MEPLGCVLSIWHSLNVFTFTFLKARWVRSLEIRLKINLFYKTWQDEANGLPLDYF